MGMENYSKHQQGIIKRYYENFDQITLQKLSELVTELYLAEGKKRDKLWQTATVPHAEAGRAEGPHRSHPREEGRDVACRIGEGVDGEAVILRVTRRSTTGGRRQLTRDISSQRSAEFLHPAASRGKLGAFNVRIPRNEVNRVHARASRVPLGHCPPHPAIHDHPVVPVPQLTEQLGNSRPSSDRDGFSLRDPRRDIEPLHGGWLHREREGHAVGEHLAEPRSRLQSQFRCHRRAASRSRQPREPGSSHHSSG